MPNPSIAIPIGSYAGSLNIAGSSKPGRIVHPDMTAEHEAASRSAHSRIPTMLEASQRADHGELMAISKSPVENCR